MPPEITTPGAAGDNSHPPDWIRLDRLADWIPDDAERYEVIEELRRLAEPEEFRIYPAAAPIRRLEVLDIDWDRGTAKIRARQMRAQGFSVWEIAAQLGLPTTYAKELSDAKKALELLEADDIAVALEVTWAAIRSARVRVQHQRRRVARRETPPASRTPDTIVEHRIRPMLPEAQQEARRGSVAPNGMRPPNAEPTAPLEESEAAVTKAKEPSATAASDLTSTTAKPTPSKARKVSVPKEVIHLCIQSILDAEPPMTLNRMDVWNKIKVMRPEMRQEDVYACFQDSRYDKQVQRRKGPE
jgi:hypothetical protein